VLCGPGLWLDWLEKLQRASLLEELLADDVIARALEEAPHRHAYDRTLTARVTVICVLVTCLFPGAGYDMALAAAFGLPGLSLKPGTAVPSGPAFSKARSLLGERVCVVMYPMTVAASGFRRTGRSRDRLRWHATGGTSGPRTTTTAGARAGDRSSARCRGAQAG
jgi:hypothetical protein